MIVSASDNAGEVTGKPDAAKIVTINIEYQGRQFYDFSMLVIDSLIKRIIVNGSVSAVISLDNR